MSLPASTTSSSMGGTAQDGNGLDREQQKAAQGGLVVSKDKEDGKGADVGVQVSLFDGLPDEVITRIFDFAVRSEPLPSGPFILNKRLYSLSRRSYYESWEADEDRLLPFLRCRDLQLLVKDLSYQPSSHNAELLAYEAATLGLLTSLRILECEGPAEASLPDDVFEFPRFFSSTLRSLRHLKALSLTFNGPFDFEDEDFTIGRDLPSLRTLTLDSNSLCTQQLLTPPCSSLRHLTICLSDSVLNHEFEDLPWTSLDEILIHVGCGAWGFRRIDGVLESLHHALQADTDTAPPSSCLTSFALWEAQQASHAGVRAADLYHKFITDARELLDLLRRMPSLRQLSLRLGASFFDSLNIPVFPSVTTLALLHHTQDFDTAEAAFVLVKTLEAFPSLVDLYIEGHRFTSLPLAQQRQHPPDSSDFLARHALLSTLLAYARLSTILYITWRPRDGKDSYRWARTSRKEEFQVDRYMED